MILVDAVRNYFAVWDRCGGSEAVSADEFAESRQAMRAALAATPALEPGWLQKSLDATAERASHMPDWMTRSAAPAVGGEALVLHPLSEIREWDEALRELGIQNSTQTPAEAVRELNTEIERLRAAVGGEPVAWRVRLASGNYQVTSYSDTATIWREGVADVEPLYAAPPASPLRGREEIIEECARVADKAASDNKDCANITFETGGQGNAILFMESAKTCEHLASKIRALSASPPEQPAAAPDKEADADRWMKASQP